MLRSAVNAAPAAALWLLAAAAAQSVSEWPRFRGPNGTGVVDGEPLPAALDPGAAIWRAALPPGHSSPVLSRDRVFLTALDGDALVTLCLERATGEVAWRRRAPRPRRGKVDKRNSPASATPAIDADTVVVFFQDFGLIAYDHAGEERWQLPLGPFDNIYGMGASPVLHGGRVFLPCDQSTKSFVIAVDASTGDVAWRVDRPEAASGHSTGIVYRPDDAPPQLVLPGSFLLDGYDMASGERVWWVRGLSSEMKSVPVLHDGRIYINGYASPLNDPGNQVATPAFADVLEQADADGDGQIARREMPESRYQRYFPFFDRGGDGRLDAGDWAYLRASMAAQNGLLAIRPGGRGDTTETSVAWAYRRSIPQLPSPVMYRGKLWVLHDQGGLVTLLDPESGERVRRFRLEAAVDSYYASPVAGDGKVYFASESGLASVVDAGDDHASLAVHDLGESCYATPAIGGGRVYLRTNAALYCFGARE